MGRRKKNYTIIIASIVAVTILGIAGVFTYQWVTHTGLFRIPGQLIFADSVPAEQREIMQTATADLKLDHNVTVNLTETIAMQPEGLLYDVLVPTTDFYNPITSIDLNSAQEYPLISIADITPDIKALALDDVYYFDQLDRGAFFQYLSLDGDESDITKITTTVTPLLPTFPTKDTLLSFAQTGVTALSRGMNAKLDQVGNASYFAEKIGPYLSSFDLTHTSNESSFSSQANSRNICSKPGMIDALTGIGIDIIELTGNHNQDCGDQDAISTIQQYREMNLQLVGGGETADAAAVPLVIDAKGAHITLLGYNLSTGGYTLDDTPGANFYTKEKALADISAAKARGDFIIVDVQYYECSSYVFETENTICDAADSAAGDQVGFFRELIDMGADVVVGTAAHQPQTYELYGDGVIYYGLGNLFFDQSWWPGTTRSLILAHYFWNGQHLQTRIVPTMYDNNLQPELLDSAKAEWFINRLNQVRPKEAKS